MKEKAKREERARIDKDRKAAETKQKQAEAQRLAGEKAEERKRKYEQASQVQLKSGSPAAFNLSTSDCVPISVFSASNARL